MIVFLISAFSTYESPCSKRLSQKLEDNGISREMDPPHAAVYDQFPLRQLPLHFGRPLLLAIDLHIVTKAMHKELSHHNPQIHHSARHRSYMCSVCIEGPDRRENARLDDTQNLSTTTNLPKAMPGRQEQDSQEIQYSSDVAEGDHLSKTTTIFHLWPQNEVLGYSGEDMFNFRTFKSMV